MTVFLAGFSLTLDRGSKEGSACLSAFAAGSWWHLGTGERVLWSTATSAWARTSCFCSVQM